MLDDAHTNTFCLMALVASGLPSVLLVSREVVQFHSLIVTLNNGRVLLVSREVVQFHSLIVTLNNGRVLLVSREVVQFHSLIVTLNNGRHTRLLTYPSR